MGKVLRNRVDRPFLVHLKKHVNPHRKTYLRAFEERPGSVVEPSSALSALIPAQRTEIIPILNRYVRGTALHTLRPVGPAKFAPSLSAILGVGQKGFFAQGHRSIGKLIDDERSVMKNVG